MSQHQTKTRNFLLAALSAADQALLDPHLERIKMVREQALVVPNEPIREVYFMEGGVASISSRSGGGRPTEIGIFGREGMSGANLLLGADRSPHETFIHVDGSHAWRIGAAELMEAVESSASLRKTLLRYVHTLFIQAGESVVANARHQVEARLARWLLMCHDRYDADEIPLTHEFMAIMVAAERSSVTLALHVLEGTGTIQSKRGRVVILDRDKLEELAGDSYGQAEAEYRRLIGPFGGGRPR